MKRWPIIEPKPFDPSAPDFERLRPYIADADLDWLMGLVDRVKRGETPTLHDCRIFGDVIERAEDNKAAGRLQSMNPLGR